jgi:hypothetical protein
MDRIITRFKVVIKDALLLERGLGGRAIPVSKTLVRTYMNVQLVVQVGIRPPDIGNAEVDQIRGLFQHVCARPVLANFLVNHLIGESERAK